MRAGPVLVEHLESAYHPCGRAEWVPLGQDGGGRWCGRVHGVDGPRVVDASVFPTIPNGNLNAPTIMPAEEPLTTSSDGAAARSRAGSGDLDRSGWRTRDGCLCAAWDGEF